MRRLVGCVLLFFWLTACQSAGSEQPHTVVDWEPTPLLEREFLPAPTEIPTRLAASLPTLAPTPTAVSDPVVPTRIPTAIPPGVYVRESDGFTLHYPSAWEFTEGNAFLQVEDFDLGLFINISGDFIDEDSDFDSYLDLFAGGEFFGSEMSIITEETIPFGETNTARIAILQGIDREGFEVGVYLAYAEQGARALAVIAFGTPENLAARRTTLDTMVNQVSLGGSLLYGLDRENMLVLLGGDPVSFALDPARTTGSAAGYVGLLYSGLVRMSPDLQVVPDLAESWVISEAGTVVTFTLREGLTFADGRPLTAHDVQYSWERAADPETESTTAATYLADILGVPEKLNGEADTIAGLEVVDDRTLVVTLDGPKPYFLAKLTYPTSFVIDAESVSESEPDEWVFTPNPSGPYKLHEWQEEEVIIFVRNEAYHTPPAIDTVTYLISRAGNRLSLFESGEIDIVSLSVTDAMRVRRPSDPLHDQWVSTTSLCTTFVQMNNTIPPLDDPLVRRAFALSVDKDGLNELLAEGTDLRADTILPPAMPGFSLALAQEKEVSTYDIQAAQEALAASSYADGLPTIILSASGFGDTERDDLNAMIETWRDVLEADVTIDFLSAEDFTSAAREEHGHMVSYGWCADYPDPENFLDILYHSESDFNVAGYHNPEVDAMLEQARVELDVSTRLALYQEIERLLLEDGAAITLWHGVSDTLVNERIEGFVLAPMGAPVIPLLSINPAESSQGGGE